ncbi:MAG: dolichyl-phosphate beta-glucosyltransferase [Candidatus Firestonebacteria bacterium]
MEDKDLTIVIPAYNEEERIGQAINIIENYLSKERFKFEIIVVNDGSYDLTSKVVEELSSKYKNIKLINNKVNSGKGYSVKCGMLVGDGQYVLFADADMSTPISEIQNMLKFFEQGYDVVIGSRRIRGSKIKLYQPILRRFLGWLFHVVRRIFYLWEIKDTQCGFKCFKKEVIKPIFSKQTINGFVFDVEILFIAKNLGYKIKEVPVVWTDNIKSTLNPFKHLKEVIKDLIRIKMNKVKNK